MSWNDWQQHTELKCCLCKWLLYNVCQISIKQNIAHTWSRCELLVYVALLWCMKCYPHQSFPFPLSCCILLCDLSCSFNHHVSELCRKAARQVNCLMRLSTMLHVESKLTIFNAFIVSQFLIFPCRLALNKICSRYSME